jgi:hypothetical protein
MRCFLAMILMPYPSLGAQILDGIGGKIGQTLTRVKFFDQHV